MSNLHFADDFEELSARASSGGTLYGLLKRQGLTHQAAIPEEEADSSPPPAPRSRRERSHSLVPSIGITEDSNFMRSLGNRQCNRPKSPTAPPNRQRRYSAACVDARDVNLTANSPHQLLPPSPKYRSPSPGSGRRHSLVTAPKEQLSPTTSAVCRRRSFSLTTKGNIINEGDDLVLLPVDGSFGSTSSDLNTLGAAGDRSRASSCNSMGSAYDSADSFKDTPIHRVLMLGGAGVGKTALTQQFLTSEYMAAQNTSFDDSIEYTIPVLLDGQDFIVDLIDLPYSGEQEAWTRYEVDAFVIVYSITDRRSYRKAVEFLTQVTTKGGKGSNCIILVANKADLERSRVINRQEGKSVAELHNAKYAEASAILNHKVDDLLVGVLKQIRSAHFKQSQPPPQPSSPQPQQRRGSRVDLIDRQDSGTAACCGSKTTGSGNSGRKGLSLRKMFMRSGVMQGLFKSRSCENLFSP